MGLRPAHACLVLCTTAALAAAVTAQMADLISAFPLDEIRLEADSMFGKAMTLNRDYMLSLDTEQLLHTFRLNAGLQTSAAPYSSSWEDPSCEVRGQFMGHYLSALAMLGKHTGDVSIASRLGYLVDELWNVQIHLAIQKRTIPGYLSAFPFEHFERLEALQPVWAPFYVIHKIMAGLLDAYLFMGNMKALDMAESEAAFFRTYIDRVIATRGLDHWHAMLENEFGGMNEVLYNLYDATENPEDLRAAQLFTKPRFFQPLSQNTDPLAGLHANTHLAQVNGFAAAFEKAQDDVGFAAVSNFFDMVTSAHSFATGGSNDHEYWGPPRTMADSLLLQEHATETEETCTQYNMLKIARYLFRWTGAPAFADYYERAILNGLIGTQRMPADYAPERGLQGAAWTVAANSTAALPRTPPWQPAGAQAAAAAAVHAGRGDWRSAAHVLYDGGAAGGNGDADSAPGPGVVLYLLPMGTGQGKGGSTRGWGTPLHSFWCCHGSSVESFAKLADSIFFHRKPAGSKPLEVYVNQYVPANLSSPLVGLRLQVQADFFGPGSTARVSLAFSALPAMPGKGAAAPKELAVKLRIPGWARGEGVRVEVNGEEWGGCRAAATHLAGSTCTVRRSFAAGDVVRLELPMSVRAERVEDDRPEYSSLHAVMLGPFLMAGLTNGSRSITADPARVGDLVSDITEPLPGYPEGSKLLSGEGQRYVIAPLGNIVEQNYTAYLDFSQPSTAAQALAAS